MCDSWQRKLPIIKTYLLSSIRNVNGNVMRLLAYELIKVTGNV